MFSWFVFQPSSWSFPSFSILHQLLVPQLLHPFDCWFPNCSPLRLFLPRSWTPSLENVPLVIAGSLLPVSSRSSHRKTSHLTLLSTLHVSRSSKPPSLQIRLYSNWKIISTRQIYLVSSPIQKVTKSSTEFILIGRSGQICQLSTCPSINPPSLQGKSMLLKII